MVGTGENSDFVEESHDGGERCGQEVYVFQDKQFLADDVLDLEHHYIKVQSNEINYLVGVYRLA